MTTQKIAVDLQARTVIGKGLAKVRHDGLVPAVIHNHGNESIHTMGDFIALTKVYSEAGKHHAVELNVDGKNHLALIKQVDFEPTKHRMRHIVFQAINRNETTTADIPVVLSEGNIPAERLNLLVLLHLDTVQVEALPRDLPDELIIDGSSLEAAGDKLTVSDITAPKGVTILADADQVMVTVEVPKDQIAEADAAQAELAADSGKPAEAEEAEVETPQSEAEQK